MSNTMMENSLMIKKKEQEYIYGKKIDIMKANGKTTNRMDLGNQYGLMDLYIQGSIRMD